jgi:hypothetical protein
MKTLAFLLLSLLPLAARAQTTVTIPSRVITIPQQVITIPAQTLVVSGTTTPPVTCVAPQVLTNGVCTTPVVTPPASGVAWVYHLGQFNWISDYSWLGSVNYKDTAGNPGDGTYDIAFTVTGQWGGWQPYDIPGGTNGPGFDTGKYKTFHFCSKPTVPNQSHGMGIDSNNDTPDGLISLVAGPGLTKYGPVPVAGQWGCYDVPIKDFNLVNPAIMKFSITDGTGLPTNKIYFKDVGFFP